MKTGRPERDEAADFFWRYIDRVAGEDAAVALKDQLPRFLDVLGQISEKQSLFRYGPDKWSIRQVLNHVTDMERVFGYRMLWFGRGFTTSLESFEEDAGEVAAQSDDVNWAAHVAAFRAARMGTIALVQTMPEVAWTRRGTAGGRSISVRALAFLSVGHVEHHLALLRERYLV